MTFVLVLLILVFAAAGGFLGDLLELAGMVILVMVALGAAAGVLLSVWVRRFFGSRQ